MPKLLPSPRQLVTACLFAALPLAAAAQNSRQDSLLRSGDLVGGRPHAARPRAASRPAASRVAAVAAAPGADPTLARLLHESINLSRVPAADLPDLYARFLEAVHAERRQWSARDWAAASDTFTQLNQRYEAVRKDLPLNERLNVRTYQGEFRALEAAASRR